MRFIRPPQASLALLSAQAVLAAAAAAAAAADCAAATFEGILADIPEASVSYAAAAAEGSSFGIPSLAFPDNATSLPAVCAVSVRVRSSADSAYNFGLFLPDPAAWNERFMATGNGGFGGGINWYVRHMSLAKEQAGGPRRCCPLTHPPTSCLRLV